MTNKEYMERAFIISNRLKARRQRLEYLKSKVGTIKHDLDGMPKSSPSSISQMEELTVRILDLESAIEQDEKTLASVRAEISAAINSLDNENLITILQMRYLDYMRWEDIMASLDYCRSYLYELHGRALKMLRIPNRLK